MSTVRRQLPVLVGTVLILLLLPAAAVAQEGGGFGFDTLRDDGEGPEQVTVTDVRVAVQDGFDRITLEIAGDGVAGYWIEYDDDPRTQGKGDPVELEGDATLRVGITNAALPPDAPDFEPFLDDVDGPEGGVITEIFNDSIFEGQHLFFVGVTQELPFRVQRLEDPQRVVVDIAHDTPVDAVETGLGGTADAGVPLVAVTAVLVVTFAVAGGGVFLRRRRG